MCEGWGAPQLLARVLTTRAKENRVWWVLTRQLCLLKSSSLRCGDHRGRAAHVAAFISLSRVFFFGLKVPPFIFYFYGFLKHVINRSGGKKKSNYKKKKRQITTTAKKKNGVHLIVRNDHELVTFSMNPSQPSQFVSHTYHSSNSSFFFPPFGC